MTETILAPIARRMSRPKPMVRSGTIEHPAAEADQRSQQSRQHRRAEQPQHEQINPLHPCRSPALSLAQIVRAGSRNEWSDHGRNYTRN